MASEIDRSPDARARAERALVRVVRALHGEDVFLVVLGGLVPEILTRGRDTAVPQHLGTTDVDILVALHVDVGRSLAQLQRALVESGFWLDPKQAGWRWLGMIDDTVVKVELLCDLDEHAAQTVWRPPGCDQLAALNLRGTGFVAEDWTWEVLAADDGGTARVRFAGLEGYLMTKVRVARERGLEKDYYDLVYTLLYNRLARPAAGLEGPAAAGTTLAQGRFAARINLRSGAWGELAARFAGSEDIGPRGYGAEALRADPASDLAQHRQDAVAAVADFLNAIRSVQAQ